MNFVTTNTYSILFLTSIVSYCSSADESFDALVFSQHWPKTVCTQWEEKDENNLCIIPEHDLWTVHGIWPTKAGTVGSFNCKNKTSKFDPSKLSSIENDLDQFWTNVEANTPHYSLWKHEWEKHGTCASILSELDDELKYFVKGLVWNKDYNIRDILEKGSIVPSDSPYTTEGVYNTIQAYIDKRPILQCVMDIEKQELFISEIRICFDKSFDLIDCDLYKDMSGFEEKDENHILTNCDLIKPIFYTNSIISELSCSDRNRESDRVYIQNLISTHEILQFLIWLTI